MIKLNIIRSKNSVLPVFYTKAQKVLAKQISEGINSSPFDETQLLQVKINDRPVSRFFCKLFDMPESFVSPNVKAVFTRARFDGEKLGAKKYTFTDTFNMKQIDELKAGKNLAKEKGSFLHKLLENINNSITE